jgi:hypothetical protein
VEKRAQWCISLVLWRLARLRQLRDVRQICHRSLAILLVILYDRRFCRFASHPRDWLRCGLGLRPLLVAEYRVIVAGDCAGGTRSLGRCGLSGEPLFLETDFAAALVAVPENEEQDCTISVFVLSRCQKKGSLTHHSQTHDQIRSRGQGWEPEFQEVHNAPQSCSHSTLRRD